MALGYEEEEESGGENPAAEALESARKALDAIGVANILAVLVVFGAVYLALFVMPRPVDVTVGLSSADFGEPVEGAVVAANFQKFLFGSYRAEATERGGGNYFFRGLPSDTPITVSFSADGYEGGTENFTASREGTDSKRFELYRKTNLRIDEAEISGTIGPSCTKSFRLNLRNEAGDDGGHDESGLSLVADGGLVVSSEGIAYLAAGESQQVQFGVTSTHTEQDREPEPIEGKIRVKGTRAGVKVLLQPAQKNILAISPPDLSLRTGSSQVLSIENRGKTKVAGIKVSQGESLVGVLAFNPEPGGAPFGLDPGAEKKFFITAVSAGMGIISVQAECNPERQVTVTSR